MNAVQNGIQLSPGVYMRQCVHYTQYFTQLANLQIKAIRKTQPSGYFVLVHNLSELNTLLDQ
jgi:ribosomal protein L32E